MLKCIKCGNVTYPALKHLHGLGVHLCFNCVQVYLRKLKRNQIVLGSEVGRNELEAKR